MTQLGMEFDPSTICGTHQTMAAFNAVTEIAMKRHLQLQSVTDLLGKYREHRGPVPTHFSWEQGNWRELCECGCVDWIDYFKEQCSLGTVLYKGNMIRLGGCVGCWLETPEPHVAPLWALADAILNKATPDVSQIEPGSVSDVKLDESISLAQRTLSEAREKLASAGQKQARSLAGTVRM
jgi:hypothetical protein